MNEEDPGTTPAPAESSSQFDSVVAIARSWKLLLAAPLISGCLALGATYLITPTFTARSSFLPPQQQNSAASALASLSALANVASSAAGLRTPADQFVALMQSATVQDRIIDRFELMKLYEVDFRSDARRNLGENARVSLSKRDGIISVEVDDKSPQRAADMANAYIDELRRLSSTLAITEAQQRRSFFERQLTQTRDRLGAAQAALQGSGFNAGALKSEPRAAAEAFAKLRAEATSAEVRLQALRGSLSDAAPEVMQQQAVLSALREQVRKLESTSDSALSSDYIGRYREFKYQETLFELFSRQFELARVDEAREGALFQVIDAAQPPEKKSRPKRAITGLVTTLLVATMLLAWIVAADAVRRFRARPGGAERMDRIKQALSGR